MKRKLLKIMAVVTLFCLIGLTNGCDLPGMSGSNPLSGLMGKKVPQVKTPVPAQTQGGNSLELPI